MAIPWHRQARAGVVPRDTRPRRVFRLSWELLARAHVRAAIAAFRQAVARAHAQADVVGVVELAPSPRAAVVARSRLVRHHDPAVRIPWYSIRGKCWGDAHQELYALEKLAFLALQQRLKALGIKHKISVVSHQLK